MEFNCLEGPVEPRELETGYLHIVVFGPGHGESILVRLPNGRVGIIDGCAEPNEASGRIDPVSTLVRALGERRLLFACLTHPHDDHYKGLAAMVRDFAPEHLWWSGTHERKFFERYLEYLEIKGGRVTVDPEGKPDADALQDVVEAINQATDNEHPLRSRPNHLADQKTLYNVGGIKIESILPSTAGVIAAEQDAVRGVLDLRESNRKGEILEEESRTERRFNPNRVSAALLLQWGKTQVLLGGDAICEKDSMAGWASVETLLKDVHCVKVPHHASRGAHLPRLWQEMKPELAIVTCFKHAGGAQPPRPEMLREILETGTEVVLTSRPKWWELLDHGLIAGPLDWKGVTAAKSSGVPGLTKSRPAASIANPHNSVVVRFDAEGCVRAVFLHGDARRLAIKPATR